MNKFENPNFEKINREGQSNISGVEEVDEKNFNNKTEEEYPEGGFNGKNDEEIIKKTPEENFINTEEELATIDNTLLEELSMEEKERLEQDKTMLEDQLQQEADLLVEKEKLIVEQEVKDAIQEKLVEEIQQLEEEGKLEKLVQELSSGKPAEIDNEGPLKEIAKKDSKTTLEIISRHLKGSQNILESIKLGYDTVTFLLEKFFKEEGGKEKAGDSPPVLDPDQSPPQENTEEKIDIIKEIAENRVFELVEKERGIRRELREKEVVLDSQNFNPPDGGEPQQAGSQPST